MIRSARASVSRVVAFGTMAGGEMVDLRRGHPASEDLPWDIMGRACAAMAGMVTAKSTSLNYGAARGNTQKLGSLLSRLYGSEVSVDRLMMTNGVSQALDMVIGAMLRSGDMIVTERPSYFLAAGIFRDHKLDVVSVGVDSGGMKVEALEAAIVHKGLRPRAVYVIPRHGNPSGATLTAKRRARLVELAEIYDFAILADEVYELLDWGDRDVLHRMACFGDRVVSLCSFSKILSPSLRLGWIEAAPTTIAQLVARGYIRSGGGLAPFHSEIALNADIDSHLAKLRATYRDKSRALCDALRANSDVLTPLVEPSGGYFVWVRLPPGVSAQAVHSPSILFLPGGSADPGGRMLDNEDDEVPLDNYIRLCFAFNPPSELSRAIESLVSSLFCHVTCSRLLCGACVSSQASSVRHQTPNRNERIIIPTTSTPDAVTRPA